MTQPVDLTPDHPAYPPGLRVGFSGGLPPTLCTLGDLALLRQPALGLFCSGQCPGDLMLKTYDLTQALQEAGIPVISGFHSPVEKECLRLLLRGTQPVLHCPARSLEGMRLSPEQKQAIARGRLLLLSAFPSQRKRATVALAEKRNQVVGAIAPVIFIAYAAPGGKTEALAQKLAVQGKTLLTFGGSPTANLVGWGAITLAEGASTLRVPDLDGGSQPGSIRIT